jgi:hypothetical protein
VDSSGETKRLRFTFLRADKSYTEISIPVEAVLMFYRPVIKVGPVFSHLSSCHLNVKLMPESRNDATPRDMTISSKIESKRCFTKDASGLGFGYSEQASKVNGLCTHFHPGKFGHHFTIANADNAGYRYPQSQVYGYWNLRIGPNYH